jgi:ribosomal protein L33
MNKYNMKIGKNPEKKILILDKYDRKIKQKTKYKL